ncbi:mobile element protein [Geminocystis sp. NIES-3708]|nr:IS982 family transposase [Geminocystis sp. NIES-3708]BAQ61675.1 mobile element protein [Geminocystis sp. NIES-3708]
MFILGELFCSVCDFCLKFEPHWKKQLLETGQNTRIRKRRLALSEIMTILISFHVSGYKDFKTFYLAVVSNYWRCAFAKLVSYQRFVEWIPSTIIPLMAYLQSCFGTSSGIGFVDWTCLKVCHHRRISQHKVFQVLAKRSKTSVDWFYGFKLHLVVNHQEELLNIALTEGNVDDRKPVPELLKGLGGKFFGDKGYICAQLAEDLRKKGILLVTKLKKNMKNKLMELTNKKLLRQPAMIESVIEQLKHI